METFAFLFLLLLTANAASQDENWTHIDTEEDESLGGSGSFEYQDLKWVTFQRDGGIHVANADELEQLQHYIGQQPLLEGKDRFASVGSMQMEDGPAKVDNTKHYSRGQESDTSSEVHDDSLEPVVRTHFYPSFAVGLLENGCTAFMVGPHHALTAAHCVYNYNESRWYRQLDLWRGRTLEEYFQWLEWEHVRIPLEYFMSGSQAHNWALITFNDRFKSPVWLRFAYSELVQDIPLILYGYTAKADSTMYSTACHSDPLQPQSQFLAIQCGTNQDIEGGPILQGSTSRLPGGRLKVPPVYGLSIAETKSFDRVALRIHSELFWSVCWLMEKEGFKNCCTPE